MYRVLLFILSLNLYATTPLANEISKFPYNNSVLSEALDLVEMHQQELQRLTAKIQKNYPPSDYIYVGVGRSPALVTAFLDALGSEVINLPLSNLSNKKEGQSLDYNTLSKHFESFLLTDSKKKMLFIDFSTRGRTILALEEIIETLRFKGLFNLANKFEFFLMVDQMDYEVHVKKALESSLNSNFSVYTLSRKPKSLGVALREQHFDNFSMYYQYDVLDAEDRTVYENPLFRHLDKAINEVFKDYILASKVGSCKNLL